MNYITALLILGIFSQRSLANSLVESSAGCTDFCYNIKSISDQQPMLQQQLKTIENNWMIQKKWTEQIETHLDRLFSVVNKLIERPGINSSDSSEMTNLSDRLDGLEKRLTEQQESSVLAESTATKRLDKLEDNQRQLVSGSQQMLKRLNRLDMQIGVDTAKIGISIYDLDKLRDRVEVLEKQILAQKENVSLCGPQSFAEALSGPKEQLSSQQQDLPNNQQQIESDRKTMEDIMKSFSKTTEPQSKVSESQVRGEQISAPEESVSLGKILEQVPWGTQHSIALNVSQFADGLSGSKEQLSGQLQDLPNNQQQIESDRKTMEDIMKSFSKTTEPQSKVSESQVRGEQISAPEESVSLGKILEQVPWGTQDSIALNVSHFADGLSGPKEHLPESPNVREIIGNLPKKLQKIDSRESKLSEMMNRLNKMIVGQKPRVDNYESKQSDLQTKLSELQKKLQKPFKRPSAKVYETIPNSLENEINPTYRNL